MEKGCFLWGLTVGLIGLLNIFFLAVHVYFISIGHNENYSVFNGVIHVILLFIHATWVSEVVDQ